MKYLEKIKCLLLENLVQFPSKQENQTRIKTFVNNLYQNYQVSLNNFFFVILF